MRMVYPYQLKSGHTIFSQGTLKHHLKLNQMLKKDILFADFAIRWNLFINGHVYFIPPQCARFIVESEFVNGTNDAFNLQHKQKAVSDGKAAFIEARNKAGSVAGNPTAWFDRGNSGARGPGGVSSAFGKVSGLCSSKPRRICPT